MIHARNDYNHIQDVTGRIPADEPVFLIRAQDRFSVRVLEFYAELIRAERAVNEAQSLVEIEHSVRAHALRMSEWPKKKTPDL